MLCPSIDYAETIPPTPPGGAQRAGGNGLLLAQEPIPHRPSGGQPFIGIAERFQQLALDRRLDHFPWFTRRHLCDGGCHTAPALLLLSRRNQLTQYCAAKIDAAYHHCTSRRSRCQRMPVARNVWQQVV
jgi:hypothetical protein